MEVTVGIIAVRSATFLKIRLFLDVQ